MELRNEANQQEFSCPVQARGATQECEVQRALLEAGDELVFPKHKRVFTQYSTDAAGVTELHLYYGEKEISFDEPELFDFGEALAKHARFVAGAATTWGKGYEWARVRDLLEQLIAEGILLHADADEDALLARELGRPSPLPPAVATVPRTWLDAEGITGELTGRCLEVGYLELVIPMYRIAHVALDAEGRQVGEANVFPPALRLDVPTEWRTCPHAGSRYQDHRPMNVTGLKAMRLHWQQMMVALLQVRETYLCRFPQARAGWTVGDLHCLSTLVLSIPSYLMMRVPNRIENGHLHPVLSSMYRVIDGVRMVMHHMLFSANVEPTRAMDAPITSDEIYAFAERNWIFHSDHGVCAGPRAMIEEFLRVVLDGQAIEGAESVVLDPPVKAALADLESVFDYVLHGLQAYAIVFSRWPEMTRTYEQLIAILATVSGPGTDTFRTLHERLLRSVRFLRNATRQNTEERREQREQVYADMHSRSTSALGTSLQDASLAQSIAPVAVGNDAQAYERLSKHLMRQLCEPAAQCVTAELATTPLATNQSAWVAQFATVTMEYFRQEQAVVRAASKVQQRINDLLGRAPPGKALTAADLAIHHRLLASIYQPEVLAGVRGRLPYLVDELEEELGLRIVLRGADIEISEQTSG